jgi:hypothetical protein
MVSKIKNKYFLNILEPQKRQHYVDFIRKTNWTFKKRYYNNNMETLFIKSRKIDFFLLFLSKDRKKGIHKFSCVNCL